MVSFAHRYSLGKKAAQLVAQAHAAHNQEILKGLNAFTQLGTDHRWDVSGSLGWGPIKLTISQDEEDDDDDVLDFGDGMIYPAHEHPSSMEPEPEQAFDEPVAQSERFVEDFDRSWPRRPPRPIPQPVLVEEAAPKRIVDGDRVLFNASSNRLESTPQRRPPPPPQALPTKLLSRDLAAPSQALERPPPVSAAIPDQPQAEVNGPAPARGPGSMLPPSLRQAWGSRDHDQRPPPSQTRELPLPSQRPDHSPRAPLSTLPPRRSFSQAKDNALPPPPPTEQHLPATSPTSSTQPVSPGDFQSQEMHAAAEKARLRRLAEEQEREAAAERARMKAKELEDRLAAKASSSKPAPEASKPSQPTVSAPPPGLASRPQIVIAQRPKPPTTLVPAQSATPITAQPTPSPSKPASGLAGLPPRPGAEPSTGESWRGKNVQPKTLLSPVATTAGRAARPTAESFFEPSPAVEAAAVDTVVNLPSSPEKQVGKKDGGFDDMLARIQAAMAQTRLAPPSPTPGPEPSRSPGRSPSIAMATAEEIKILSHSTPLPTQEYFDVTQIPIPKSPPPAWRTFAVKLPRSSQPRLPPPRWRIEAFETSLRHIPKGWIMSFNPPVDQLNPLTLSRAELLLPAQVPRRFSRHFDSGPIVSISPRRLETMSKPKKKPIFEAARPAEVIQPVTSTSTLLPPTVDQAPSTSSLTDPRWAAGPSVDALVNDLLPPSKTFVASIPNAPLTKDAAFTPEDSRATASVAKLAAQRPGVRFMVSSEMEGESLLNEINKMSLESVGEGTEDKTDSPKSRSSARASGGEVSHNLHTSQNALMPFKTPKTPPSLSASSSREPHSSPTNEASTPWSKTSGRSVSQHDQIRAFWDPSRPVETAPTRPTEVAVVNPQSLDPSVPTYASLNGPSPSDSGAPRTVNTNLKMGAVSSQPFSPASDPSSSFSMRQTSSGGAGFALSPEQQNMIGLYARSPANNQSTVANGYGTQQGVWSPSVFNTGYGYIKPVGSGMSAIDQKAALAFNSAQSPQMQHAKPTPNGSMYGALGNNDFRFPNQQSYSTSPYQAQSQAAAQAFQVQQAQQAASPQHQFMQSPYTNPRGTIAVASPPQQAAYNPYGSVQYGAAASQLGAGVRGRTGNASVDGSAEFGYQAGGGQFGHLTTSASGYSPAFAAGGPNSRSVSGVHGAIGQQGRAGAGVGMGSAQRRVW